MQMTEEVSQTMTKQKTSRQNARIQTELTELERRLLGELQQRMQNVRNVSADDPTEFFDLASDGELDYMSAMSAEAGSETIRDIQRALRKLREGTYGKCDDCGGRIGKRRLQARPFAALCIQCKTEQERHRYAGTALAPVHSDDAHVPDVIEEDQPDHSGQFNDLMHELDDVELRGMF